MLVVLALAHAGALSGCGPSEATVAAGRSRAALTTLWTPPPDQVAVSSGRHIGPLWDGTRWWLLNGPAVVQVSAQGAGLDAGGLILPYSALGLAVLGGGRVVAVSAQNQGDGGSQLRAHPLAPAAPEVDLGVLPSGGTVVGAGTTIAITGDRKVNDGGTEGWALTLDGDGRPLGPPAFWPSPGSLEVVHFDGQQILAVRLVGTGLVLCDHWGEPQGRCVPLALPHQLNRPVRMGGDAELAGVFSGWGFQLVVDGGPSGAAFAAPATGLGFLAGAFRSGRELVAVTTSEYLRTTPSTSILLQLDGGSVVGPPLFPTEPLNPVQTMYAQAMGVGLAPQGALAVYRRIAAGTSAYAVPIDLAGAPSSPPIPLELRPARTRLPSVRRLGSGLLVSYIGERVNEDDPALLLRWLDLNGSSGPQAERYLGFPPVYSNSYGPPHFFGAGSRLGGLWKEGDSEWAGVVSEDGGLIAQTLSLAPSLSTGGGFDGVQYLVAASYASSVRVLRFDLGGNPIGSPVNALVASYASICGVDFDGVRFHLVAADQTRLLDIAISPTGVVAAPRQLGGVRFPGLCAATAATAEGVTVAWPSDAGWSVARLFPDGGSETSGFDLPLDAGLGVKLSLADSSRGVHLLAVDLGRALLADLLPDGGVVVHLLPALSRSLGSVSLAALPDAGLVAAWDPDFAVQVVALADGTVMSEDDAGTDAGPGVDAGVEAGTDAGTDAGAPDGGGARFFQVGCGCSEGGSAPGALWFVLALAAARRPTRLRAPDEAKSAAPWSMRTGARSSAASSRGPRPERLPWGLTKVHAMTEVNELTIRVWAWRPRHGGSAD